MIFQNDIGWWFFNNSERTPHQSEKTSLQGDHLHSGWRVSTFYASPNESSPSSRNQICGLQTEMRRADCKRIGRAVLRLRTRVSQVIGWKLPTLPWAALLLLHALDPALPPSPILNEVRTRCRSPPHTRVLTGCMQVIHYATRRILHGASRLMQAMPAWFLRPRRAPPRFCRDARVLRSHYYGHAWYECTRSSFLQASR